ncbi:MAG: hypothetical protein V4710_24385, partial [Verrucomicrobiota bacterium]
MSWLLQVQRGTARQRLATGTTQGGNEIKAGPFHHVAVRPGDLVSLHIGPRGGDHSCDLTAVDLVLSNDEKTWSLAADVSPDILAALRSRGINLPTTIAPEATPITSEIPRVLPAPAQTMLDHV